MKTILKIQDLDIRGRRVFLRVDFNVPLRMVNGKYEVADASRIMAALPTIQHVINQGAKCILASHLGRPNGQPNPKFSLEPVGAKLTELLKKDIILTEDCVGDGPRGLSQHMRSAEVMLLENLRFHSGEEENSVEFANRLSELCDIYVSDAFGTLHRAHASTAALPKIAQTKCMGFLVQRELEYLQPLRDNPARPFVLIMGGAKVSDKIGVLEHFMEKVDTILVGGAMAYAFLNAMGVKVGKSFCVEKEVLVARSIMKVAAARKVKILLPVDHVVTSALNDTSNVTITASSTVPDNYMGVDIGPKTIELFSQAVQGAETIFWNGPMGVFETPAFATGTFELAKAIAASPAKKLVGGGDSVAAIAQAGLEAKFDFISTGGGATLEYLEGQALPGIAALEVFDNNG